MKLLVLDNYDSFTWNLVHALEAAGGRCEVHRSDRLRISDVEAMAPQGIILSPGPFGPHQTGICQDVVRTFSDRIPMLGVCLGMQVIATVLGAEVRPSGRPVHGKTSPIHHDNRGVLQGLPNPFDGGRYHSLIVEASSASPDFEASAWTEDRLIMACRYVGRPVDGVLFHPESFLTEQGSRVFTNFLESAAHVV